MTMQPEIYHQNSQYFYQCWTKGRSSTAVAEVLGPTATATVAEVFCHSYGRRFFGPNIRLRPKVKIVPTVQH